MTKGGPLCIRIPTLAGSASRSWRHISVLGTYTEYPLKLCVLNETNDYVNVQRALLMSRDTPRSIHAIVMFHCLLWCFFSGCC